MDNKCPKCKTENPSDSKYCKECATRLPSSEELTPLPTETIQAPKKELTTGSIFAGRYQIMTELGKGGMGRVYRALDQKINEEVAIKLIKPEIAKDKRTIERFSNELKMARKIAHRNVCKMYYLGEEEGAHYITMEYIPGEDLKSMIRMSGQLSTSTVIKIAGQVCDGLNEAHRLGVIHRDLKPNNIMIDKQGNARIMDFGIARSLSTEGITGSGIIIGTPEYMSPEQVEGKETDQRSDIYSLGVILYEMATGRVPFEGDTPFTIGVKHKSEMPTNPQELNDQIPDDLSEIILKCLEKDKEKRFQSAEEVQTDLTRIAGGIPTTEREDPAKRTVTSKEITVTFGPKKIIIPIAAIIILAVIAVLVWQFFPKKEVVTSGFGKASLAVLPFEDISQQKDYEHLCDGIAETLLNALNNISDLRIPGRTSSFSFKGKGLTVQEIGQKLNVENILEGTVQVEGNRLRITARLSKVADGFQIWSENYEKEMEDVFSVQDDIARNIIKSLKIKLIGEKGEQIIKHYTDNIEAYDLYVNGRQFVNMRTEESLKKAIEYFGQAIEKEPNYALAYAGLSYAYDLLPDYSYVPRTEATSMAKEAASKALELDDDLAEAHFAMASTHFSEWNWKKAEREYKKAIELNPNYAETHHSYAMDLAILGRFDEAIREIELARRLDPFSLVINRNVGQIYYLARQFDSAIEASKHTLEMAAIFPGTHWVLGMAYLEKGMFKEALAELEAENEITGIGFGVEPFMIVTYARMGDRKQAEIMLKKLQDKIKGIPFPPFALSIMYLHLDERDKAIVYLEKAFETRDNWLRYIKVMPLLDPFRNDPRFQAIIKKMGLD
ncbi:MAG: protein kinase [Candidatus Aminicenantes bacterium]|nr:MAG: protein kinase [Candidatus Aminicenantes bacterium]